MLSKVLRVYNTRPTATSELTRYGLSHCRFSCFSGMNTIGPQIAVSIPGTANPRNCRALLLKRSGNLGSRNT
ncbi:hypothetical protein D3C78_1844960 [compost metagenome]